MPALPSLPPPPSFSLSQPCYLLFSILVPWNIFLGSHDTACLHAHHLDFVFACSCMEMSLASFHNSRSEIALLLSAFSLLQVLRRGFGLLLYDCRVWPWWHQKLESAPILLYYRLGRKYQLFSCVFPGEFLLNKLSVFHVGGRHVLTRLVFAHFALFHNPLFLFVFCSVATFFFPRDSTAASWTHLSSQPFTRTIRTTLIQSSRQELQKVWFVVGASPHMSCMHTSLLSSIYFLYVVLEIVGADPRPWGSLACWSCVCVFYLRERLLIVWLCLCILRLSSCARECQHTEDLQRLQLCCQWPH